MQALAPETEDVGTVASNLLKVHSLKAAIFHTMAYKFSLEINKNKLTPKPLIAFLKVLFNVAQIKKKKSLSNSTPEFIWLAQKSLFAKLHQTLSLFQIPHLHQRINTSTPIFRKP